VRPAVPLGALINAEVVVPTNDDVEVIVVVMRPTFSAP